MEMMLAPLRKYAQFDGRARRQEYWMFFLFQILVIVGLQIIAAILGMMAGGFSSDGSGVGVVGGLIVFLAVIFVLGMFIPSLAVSFRRLHDTNRSAWWILINLIPFGGIVLLIFMCLEGTPGPNQYGPDPKGRTTAQTVDTFS